MYLGGHAQSWALVALVLCLGFPSAESQLEFDNCPSNIMATRSDLVYWSPPIVRTNTVSDFVVTGTHQPGRYYYETTTVTYTVTYTATDSTETITCSFVINIEDNGSPVITSCPGDITASAPEGQTEVSVSWSEPVVANSSVRVTSDKSSNALFDVGRNTVKYTFTFINNANAPQSFCSFDVFVQESASTTVPTIDCPDPILVTLALGQESMAITWDDPTYPDNLGSVTIACGRQKNDNFFAGRNEITCVAYFENGEARMCSFTVTVTATEDTENPSIIDCPGDIMEYVAPAAGGKVVTWTEPTIIDNTQQDLILQASHTNGDYYNVGSYDVIYTGSDASGNEVTCTFRITVENDNQAPIILGCLALQNNEYFVQAGETSGIVTWVEPTAMDNADQNVQLVGPRGTLANGGRLNVGETRPLSYVATDDFGNTQTCDFTVTLLVDQVPQYSGCSTDMSFPTNPGSSYTNVSWPEPRVTDDRSTNELILTKSLEPGMNYEIGVYVVEYTATDAVENVGICSFVITVEDRENPTLTSPCPNSQVYFLGQSEDRKYITWMNPTATDNSCADDLNCATVTSNKSPGLYTLETYTVNVTAMDAAGNTDTSCSFTIDIRAYIPDVAMPMWANCPMPVGGSIAGSTDSGLPTRTVTWSIPTSSDDREIATEFASHTPPFAFSIGSHTVVYRATDTAGNEGVCTFDVTITDNESPVWTPGSGCGTTITHYVLPNRVDNLAVALPSPSATDNSGVVPGISNSLNVNEAIYAFQSGTNTIQYTATDGYGNSISNCVVSVLVVRAQDTWSLRGSLQFSRIRGISGQFSDAVAPQLLNELASDMDRFFRGTSIGSHFVGAASISNSFSGGNQEVMFRLYFTKDRQGRHTSRQIMEAFYTALANTNTFATSNFVVSGTLEFHVREFKFTTKIVGLDNLNDPPFVSQYDDPASSRYIVLEDRINTEMDKTYSAFFGYAVSVLVDLRSGSIDNDIILVFDDTSTSTEASITTQFNNQLDNNGQLYSSGLYYNTVPAASNQELCPDDECQNGGTCSVDTTYTNVCTCPDKYTGTNCETETSVLSPLLIAAIIGGAILLLLLLFALFCCCMYFCRGSYPYKDDRYLQERPFQIVEEEPSVASSMDVFMMPRERYYLEPPPPAPILALPPAPPPEAPTLHLDNHMMYGRDNDMFAMDMYPSDGPSFSPDGEVYVTGPNQVAIRPSTKRGQYYRY